MKKKLLFGVSGWDYVDWRGPLYPTRPPRGFRALPLLARFLDFMEVNVTFYRPLGGSVAQRWLQETPPRFQFVVKAFGGWTHRGEKPEGEALTRFREIIDPILGSQRLAGVLVQYPPSFRDTKASREELIHLRDALTPARVFVEVRSRALYRVSFLSFLESHDLNFVNVDLPEMGTLPRMTRINTGPQAFLRLHGRNALAWANPRAGRDQRYDHQYSREELSELLEVVGTLLERAPTVLVGANNHFRAQAPAAMVLMRSLWQQQKVPAPSSLLEAYPELREHAYPLTEE
ncbi:MAG: DUF72 domain-containing protein [Planctomycetota bacterium]